MVLELLTITSGSPLGESGESFEVGPGPANPDWTRESRFTALTVTLF